MGAGRSEAEEAQSEIAWHCQPSFRSAEQLYGRERLSRPRPEAIERKLRLLAGLHVHEDVVVFLFGALPLPIEIRRVALGYLDVGSTGKDRILLGAPAAEQQVLHAVHLVE